MRRRWATRRTVPAAATPTAPAATPRTRRVVLTLNSLVAPLEAATDPGDDLVGDRPARVGPVLRGGLPVVTRAEEGDGRADRRQVAAEVDHDLVHADAPADRTPYAVDGDLEHVAAVTGHAVAVPGGHETHGRRLVGDPVVAVRDALARRDRLGERERRGHRHRGAQVGVVGGVGRGVEAERRQPDAHQVEPAAGAQDRGGGVGEVTYLGSQAGLLGDPESLVEALLLEVVGGVLRLLAAREVRPDAGDPGPAGALVLGRAGDQARPVVEGRATAGEPGVDLELHARLGTRRRRSRPGVRRCTP